MKKIRVELYAVKDGILKFTCYNESGKSIALDKLTDGQIIAKKAFSGSEVYIGVSVNKNTKDIDYSFSTSLITSI